MGAKKIKVARNVQKKAPIVVTETSIDRWRTWAEKNFSYLLGAGAAVLCVVALSWGLNVYDGYKRERAQEAYTLLAAGFPAEGKGSPADWEKLIPELQKFISGHDDTPSALDARMELAKAFFEATRYEDSIRTATEALQCASAESGLQPLLHYQLAFSYEAAGKPEQALKEWTTLKDSGIGAFEREAAWNMARIYAARKDHSKAAEFYQMALKTPGAYPSSPMIDQKLVGAKSEAQAPAQ